MVGAIWLARAGQRAPALFLGVYGLMDLKSELSGDGKILAAFTSPIPAPRADVWWTLILLGAALLWLARGRLTERRAGHLLFLTLILLLLSQTDFSTTEKYYLAGRRQMAVQVAHQALRRVRRLGSVVNEARTDLLDE